jgi:pimeloyl-ACP methyl ester carboxylesterase
MPSKPTALDFLLSPGLVERAFAAGEHQLELAEHFGEELFARLRGLAESLGARPASASSPRVLIVPGLPGTTLGRRGAIVDDTIWFTLESVVAGRLLELAVHPGMPRLEPLEALPSIYLQLKLRLQLAGYDVELHPYDWRMSLDQLGAELAARLAREDREVHLVGHSFGGLVSRAAIAMGAPNVGKVVMLGTPNHGLFSVVQGIRGNHWMLRALSAFDPSHTAHELAEKAFSTFPAVYEQLPSRRKFGDVDLYDPATWPETGPAPRRDLLLRAPAVQDRIASARGTFTVIAGYGYPTIDGIERTDRGFRYHRSTDGDGWVAASLAVLDEAPRYYVAAPHIGMPNDELVLSAVEDLLEGAGTDKLPEVRPAAARLRDHHDDEPLPPRFGGRRGLELTAEDLQEVLGQLFSVRLPVTA